MEIIDKLKHECGVFGIFNHPESSNITYLGLHGLQHRGQECAGMVTSDGNNLYLHRQMGLVVDVFTASVLEKLKGNRAIGHVRYSTAGSSILKNAQPFAVSYSKGSIAVAHNGNLVNALSLKAKLEEAGSIFHSTSDSEVMIHLIALSKGLNIIERILEMTSQIKGAYSCLFLTEKEMIAIRDPNGFRPLVLGSLDKSHVIASETCSLDLIGAKFEREIEPGEMLVISESGLKSYRLFPPCPHTSCIFEYIYFARPDSYMFGRQVYDVRKELGKQLAREQPAKNADMVIPVPDSGVGAAIGYAYELGIPFDMGMIRSHYVGRTFIEPEQRIRHFGVKLKLNVAHSTISGKKVVIVDDSIIRGTTSRKIVEMVRSRGAKEVHLRISSPPTRCSCFYGIDTPNRDELIASSQSIEKINKFITSDSLGYLSVEGMHGVFNAIDGERGFCDACFTGNYPLLIEEEPISKSQMHLFENCT